MTDRGNKYPLVLPVIFITCLLPEVLLTLSDFGVLGSTHWRAIAIQNGGFWPGLLVGSQPSYPIQPFLMFLSYGFLHAGPFHFGVNMMALFVLGRVVISQNGPIQFLVIYMLSLVGGGVSFGLLSRGVQPMVGASGGLYGLIGALAVTAWRLRKKTGQPLWPIARFFLAIVIFNLGLLWVLGGQLAWQAHLGGLVAGALIAMGNPGR